MITEDLIIQSENEEGPITVLTIDDHMYHLKGHLKYIWKPTIFIHCFQHLKILFYCKRNGIPMFKIDEVLKAVHKRDHNILGKKKSK